MNGFLVGVGSGLFCVGVGLYYMGLLNVRVTHEDGGCCLRGLGCIGIGASCVGWGLGV